MKGFIKGTRTDQLITVHKNIDGMYLTDTGTSIEPWNFVVMDLEDELPSLIVNSKNTPINISHFQGTSQDRLDTLISKINDTSVLDNFPSNELSIITVYTDEDKCILSKQLKKFGIPFINGITGKEDRVANKPWEMPDKIYYILNALSMVKTEYVLILDGYDVLINSFDNILYKFKNLYSVRMLFNATKNNYPNVLVDRIHDRDWRGDFRYFNAGCAIGYTSDFLAFYQECYKIRSQIPNIWDSEQYILRNIFAKYSEDLTNSPIDFDWKCDIFQTYMNTVQINLAKNIIAIV